MTYPRAVFEGFLAEQLEQARALNRDSDLVEILPLGEPADRFLVHFSCTGLEQTVNGSIVEGQAFTVGVRFPAEYLRVANPFEVVTWISPPTVFHPNISPAANAICIGRVAPGTSLTDVVYQCWELITWQRATLREDDALNHVACEWARYNQSRLPVDTRPLKRAPLVLDVVDISPGANDGLE